ncbi:MAG: hypothetical protein K0S01_1246 [Herbinix sp.]|nr:hypothetical protein [Herbinix sp.]
MERNVSLNEISDGKLYDLNDLVKADCNECKGCFACCQGMGNSIMLDPLDIYRLLINLNITFAELIADKIELNIVDGIIMPNLKMNGLSERCSFLNEEGRCGIHAFRPGICRLFPLGRYYENHAFKYFLQVHECKKQNKTKIKVRKWIDTPDLKKNEQFVIDWHYFLQELQNLVKGTQDEKLMKDMNMYILKNFYITPYDAKIDFYLQFNERLGSAKEYVAENL